MRFCLQAVRGVLRTFPSFALVALLLAGSLVLSSRARAQDPTRVQDPDRKLLDRIVAIVGDDIVLKSDVDQLILQMTQQSGTSYSDELWMQGLNQLIDQKILAEKARRDTTITIAPQQVDSQLDLRIQQLQQQAGGQEELENIYGKSVLELKEAFRDEFRDQLLAEQLRSRRLQKVNITPSEVQDWFEEIPQDSLPRLPETVRLAHIVRYPKPTETAREEARQIITTIRDSIVSDGASFEEMAQQFSDDSGTASKGGRLVDVKLEELVPEFAAVAARTPVGEISQVFYNDAHNGYHILRVNARQAGTVDLNHILIRIDQSDVNASEAIDYLSAVRDTLLEYDVPFELMARRHSEEEQSAENGGRVTDPSSGVRDLVLEALGPTWRRTIRSIEVGEISEPSEVQLLNGDRAYHIVKLQRRMPAHRVSLETDYERIRQYALQDKRRRALDEWLTELREEVFVDVRVKKEDLTAMRF